MLNLSVDVADQVGQFDPNVNEIESIVELVFEVVLDKGNVLVEEDEPDPETNTCLIGLYHIIPMPIFELQSPESTRTQNHIDYIPVVYSNPSMSINPNPPQG